LLGDFEHFSESSLSSRMKRGAVKRTPGGIALSSLLLLLPISSIQGKPESHFHFLLLPVPSSWGSNSTISNLTEREEEELPQQQAAAPSATPPAAEELNNYDDVFGHDHLMDICWAESGGGYDDSKQAGVPPILGINSSLLAKTEEGIAEDMMLVLSVTVVATALLAVAAAYLLLVSSTSSGSGMSRKVGRLSFSEPQRRHSLLFLNDEDDDGDDDEEEYGFVDTIKARHQLHQPLHNTNVGSACTTHHYGSNDSSQTVIEQQHSSSTTLPAAETTAKSSSGSINIIDTVPSAVSSIQQPQQHPRPLSFLWAYRPSSQIEKKYKPLCPTVPEVDETEYSDDHFDDEGEEEYAMEEKASSSSSSVVMDLDGILSELAFALL
jgi:hypothetical protein